jgi:hypothetical protein
MTRWKTMIVAAAAALTFGVARAQDAPGGPPDPARLALAEQIVAASGGSAQVAALLRSTFGAVQKNIVANASPESRDFIGPMIDDMTQEIIALSPRLLELSTRAYAQAFSEKELRDLLAFQTSETGKAVISKLPAIQAQVVSQTIPLMMAAMPAILHKSIDRICDQKHCTSEQRAAVDQAMSKAIGDHPS